MTDLKVSKWAIIVKTSPTLANNYCKWLHKLVKKQKIAAKFLSFDRKIDRTFSRKMLINFDAKLTPWSVYAKKGRCVSKLAMIYRFFLDKQYILTKTIFTWAIFTGYLQMRDRLWSLLPKRHKVKNNVRITKNKTKSTVPYI